MTTFPLSRRRALAGAVLLAAALFVAGRYLAGAGASSGASGPAERPLEAVEAAAPAALVVHVVGAVRRPGLYRLRDGARVADAVARAGGATRRADVSLVNLAEPVADGVQVVVPRRAPAAASGSATAPQTPAGPLTLTTATLMQLSICIRPSLLAVCRLPPDADVTPWVRGSFTSVTRTQDELSVVCDDDAVPVDVK